MTNDEDCTCDWEYECPTCLPPEDALTEDDPDEYRSMLIDEGRL